jgi:tetratricopeptide (TPR) repeat protein
MPSILSGLFANIVILMNLCCCMCAICTFDTIQQTTYSTKGPKRKTGKTAGCLLPEDIGTMLGQAHRFFLEGRYADALPLLSEVVRLAPGHPDAYTTLGMTFEAQANDGSLAARHHRRHRQHDATAATSTTATTAIASAATTAYQGITSATATNAATMTTAVSRASAAGFRAQALQMFVVAAELDRKNKVPLYVFFKFIFLQLFGWLPRSHL